MDDFDGVAVHVQHGRVVEAHFGVADGGFAVDFTAGFEGGGEEGVDGVAGRGCEGDVGGSCFYALLWRG